MRGNNKTVNMKINSHTQSITFKNVELLRRSGILPANFDVLVVLLVSIKDGGRMLKLS